MESAHFYTYLSGTVDDKQLAIVGSLFFLIWSPNYSKDYERPGLNMVLLVFSYILRNHYFQISVQISVNYREIESNKKLKSTYLSK